MSLVLTRAPTSDTVDSNGLTVESEDTSNDKASGKLHLRFATSQMMR